MTDSAQAWAAGVFPATGARNETLHDRPCGPMLYRGAYCGMRADWKAQKQAHDFSRSWQSTFCCSRCLATAPFKHAPAELVYLDFSERAPYASTTISTEDYLAYDKKPSPWRIVRGFTLESCHSDILHVIFLGIGRGLCASLLVEVLEALPGTEAKRLGQLNEEFVRWCRSRKRGAQRPCCCPSFSCSSDRRAGGDAWCCRCREYGLRRRACPRGLYLRRPSEEGPRGRTVDTGR